MIFGRDRLVESVARYEGSVLLLTGDAGVGKSAVLHAAATLSQAGWLSADARPLRYSRGSLDAAFLDGLGEVLGVAIERGLDQTTLGERLAEAARRFANEKDSVLARVIFAELLEVVRSRAGLGGNFGNATAGFARNLWPDTAERMFATVARGRDQLTAEILSGYATAATDLLAEQHLALHLDRAENLSDDDLRLLCDLADLLPDRFHLRLALAIDSIERHETMVRLTAASPKKISTIDIPPLAKDDVAVWLAAEGLGADLVDDVMRETGGYPLRIETLITDVLGGGEVSDVARDSGFAARTRASWERLSSHAANAARRLAVLREPTSEDQLRQVAGYGTMSRWAGVAEELEKSCIFSVEINGVPWFHSERQAFILRECLTAEQRDSLANDAAEILLRFGSDAEGGTAPGMAEVLHLARQSSRFRAAHPEIAAVIGLSTPALATAAALLELRVGDQPVSVDADPLLGHALTLTSEVDDPVAALSELDEKQLASIDADESATIVTAAWEASTELAIVAEGADRLSRPPVPRIAEALFDHTVKSELGDAFIVAHYGIGNPSIAHLGALGAQQPGSPFIDRRNLGWNLLVRGRMDSGVSLYGVVRFEDEETRNAALAGLRGREFITPFGDISFDVLAHPQRPVPSCRFASALSRATGMRLRSDTKLPSISADGENDDETLAERRVMTAAFIRNRSRDDLERTAVGLDRGYLLAWDAGEEFWIECVIRSDRDEQHYVPALHEIPFRSPYGNMQVRQACALENRDDFIFEQSRYGSDVKKEPVTEEISYRMGLVTAFNRSQPRLEVRLDEADLQPQVEQAFLRELEDAREMARSLPFLPKTDEIPPTALWLLITLGAQEGMPVFEPFHARANSALGPSPSGADQARVRIIPAAEHHPAGDMDSRGRLFGSEFPDAVVKNWTSGMAHGVIARLLGYHSNDIELILP